MMKKKKNQIGRHLVSKGCVCVTASVATMGMKTAAEFSVNGWSSWGNVKKRKHENKETERERQSQSSVKVQKEPEEPLVGEQKEKETPMHPVRKT